MSSATPDSEEGLEVKVRSEYVHKSELAWVSYPTGLLFLRAVGHAESAIAEVAAGIVVLARFNTSLVE